MAGRRRIDKYWIDENFKYLEPRLSILFPFEISDSFYDDLGMLGEHSNPGDHCNKALDSVFSHLHLEKIPVYFESLQKNAGEFRYSVPRHQSSGIVPEDIRISDRFKNIENARIRGMAIGAIISHELSHYYVIRKGILRDTDDNERLTDLAIVILGLGKLYFNGRDFVVNQERLQLGYLQCTDMVYAFKKYQDETKISEGELLRDLSSEARRMIASSLKSVNEDLEEYAGEEHAEQFEIGKKAVLADCSQLKSKVERALPASQNIAGSLTIARKNQEIINRTHPFWNISDKDNVTMGEFTIALHSASWQIAHDHIMEELKRDPSEN